MRGAVDGDPARQKRRVKKFTESRAKNIAEAYIAQREASTGMVRALLRRRANSWLRLLDEGEREAAADEASRIIEAEVSRLVAKRYVDDARFARMKVRSGLASGKGIARIARELGQKGLGAEELEDGLAKGTASFVEDRSSLLAPEESEPDPAEMRREAEQEAARIFARKKRIGPWRKAPLPEDFKEARKIWNREAGAMARAGYSFDLIREILDGEPKEKWRDF
ncbi:regulatory protein RecX [Amaricoccus macauensis]|uniref:regulatory protein RecX n=1 Tax=Amaricoccus macauensis TaxID=57001 RepID=UPI003C7AEB4C